MGDQEGTIQIENDGISMKTKPLLTQFGLTFGTLRIDEKSFFKTLWGFTPFWDYKATNAILADIPGVYTSEKILCSSTIKKLNLNVIFLTDMW